MKHLLGSPSTSVEESNRLSRILGVILYIMLSGSAIIAVVGFATENPTLTFKMLLTGTIALVGLFLSRRRRAQETGFVVLLFLIGILGYLMVGGSGIHDIAIMLVPIIILVAGLLLTRAGLILIAALTAATMALVTWGEIAGIIKTPYASETSWEDLIIIVVIISISATTVRILSEGLRDSLRKVRLSEAKYKALLDNTPSVIYINGLQGDNPVQFISPQIQSLLGYPPQAYLDEPYLWIKLLHPEDKDRVLEENARTNRTGEPFIIDYRMISQDGNIVWVHDHAILVLDPNGRPDFWLGMWTDVTERKKMEEQLRFSEERYRLISGVSVDYTFSTEVDSLGNMRLNWVAGAFEEMTGFSFTEYVQTGGWREHMHPDDIKIDIQYFHTLQSNQPVVGELRTFHKNGKIRWVRVYAHPVWDSTNARLTGIYGAVQDITDRKQVEAEREKLIQQLEAKNTELERFTYTVSHDLKSPLVTISGYLDYLNRDAQAGDLEKMHQDSLRISQAVEIMQDLLNDLLDLSRIGRMMNPSEETPFREIVLEALELVRGRLEARKVTVEVEENLPKVYGDRARLVEVVQNLVDNASKFMGDQPNPLIQIGSRGLNEEGHPLIFIRDNGIGIDKQFHERIFGLFNKLDPSAEGTGIGLTLVKRIIELHGGCIRVESDGRNGSTFIFSIASRADTADDSK